MKHLDTVLYYIFSRLQVTDLFFCCYHGNLALTAATGACRTVHPLLSHRDRARQPGRSVCPLLCPTAGPSVRGSGAAVERRPSHRCALPALSAPGGGCGAAAGQAQETGGGPGETLQEVCQLSVSGDIRVHTASGSMWFWYTIIISIW